MTKGIQKDKKHWTQYKEESKMRTEKIKEELTLKVYNDILACGSVKEIVQYLKSWFKVDKKGKKSGKVKIFKSLFSKVIE